MASRVIALLGAAKIPLTIASEITIRGNVVIKRLVDAIDPAVIKAVAYKVEAAYNEDTLFSNEEKKELSELEITSMPHESELDLNCHVSVAAKNHSKNVFKKGHVTIDPAQQQAAR